MSGNHWVSRFPQSRNTGDLLPDFAAAVDRFIEALRTAGATVSVSTTYRPPERAYLMHYCTKIANGELDPSAVPEYPNVEIEWNHTDADGVTDRDASRAAAQAMVAAYGIAHPPALVSRHTQRRAIDMTISWTGDLNIIDGDSASIRIASSPRSGGNSELHRVGASYGVIKLVSDPPHWSDDGH